MTLPDPRKLALQTLTDPAGAARILMALNLPRGLLWQAVVLVNVLQAAIYAISKVAAPGPQPLDWLLGSPLQFLAISLASAIVFIHALHLFGRMFGGHGSVGDVLVVMVWLLALRVVLQALAMLLSVTVPVLAVLLMFATLFIGFYVTLHFIDQSLHLRSLVTSFFVFICASLVLLVGLSLLIPLTGGPPNGFSAHV